jgi:hypothetical protein
MKAKEFHFNTEASSQKGAKDARKKANTMALLMNYPLRF